jgi:hypothetical protein
MTVNRGAIRGLVGKVSISVIINITMLEPLKKHFVDAIYFILYFLQIVQFKMYGDYVAIALLSSY